MLSVTLSSGRTMEIRFTHSLPLDVLKEMNDKGEHRRSRARSTDMLALSAYRRLTHCEINELTYTGGSGLNTIVNRRLVSEGLAICHPKDRFERRSGRKLALTNALTNAAFDVNDREAIWSAYFAHCRDH